MRAACCFGCGCVLGVVFMRVWRCLEVFCSWLWYMWNVQPWKVLVWFRVWQGPAGGFSEVGHGRALQNHKDIRTVQKTWKKRRRGHRHKNLKKSRREKGDKAADVEGREQWEWGTAQAAASCCQVTSSEGEVVEWNRKWGVRYQGDKQETGSVLGGWITAETQGLSFSLSLAWTVSTAHWNW